MSRFAEWLAMSDEEKAAAVESADAREQAIAAAQNICPLAICSSCPRSGCTCEPCGCEGCMARLERAGEADRIVEERLGRADLDQDGREAREIGAERRDERVARVAAREVSGGELAQVGAVD